MSTMRNTLVYLVLTLAPTLALAQAQTCLSFGLDFQDGGSYFQNISSTDPFTFVQSFEGCEVDVSDNILVDPSGDEIICTDTPLAPDDVAQLSTCQINKNQLTSGDWSILVLSNNGPTGEPIAYERDFILSVGVPSTITATPTVSLTITQSTASTATSTVTEIDTETDTTTLIVPISTEAVTETIKSTTQTTITTACATVTKKKHTVIPVVVTHTHTATCIAPPRPTQPDPTCRFTPTLVYAAAMETPSSTNSSDSDSTANKRLHRFEKRKVSAIRAQRVKERRARLAAIQAGKLQKRAPDSATITVFDTVTAAYPTVTFTTTPANATDVTVTVTATVLTTDLATITSYSGISQAPVVTITEPVDTITITKDVKTTTFTTHTYYPTVTVTTTVYPSGMVKQCHGYGGKAQ